MYDSLVAHLFFKKKDLKKIIQANLQSQEARNGNTGKQLLGYVKGRQTSPRIQQNLDNPVGV